MEIFSALVNDTAMHIEETMAVIDNFELDEIRARIDEMFDSVTSALVECGQACVDRLTAVVMGDLSATMSEIFTPDWLSPDGKHIKVAIATTSDYFQDFKTLLVPFWLDKLTSRYRLSHVTWISTMKYNSSTNLT